MKEYEDVKLTNATLSIVKLFDKPKIANKDDVTDDLGEGIPEEIYLKYFKQKFVAGIHVGASSLKKIEFVDSIPKTELYEKTLIIPNDVKLRSRLPDIEFKISLPQEGKKLESVNTAFILFLYNLDINRIAPTQSIGVNMNGIPSGGGSPGKLFHQLNFALWDNEKGKLVSFGKVTDESTIVFAMNESNWSIVIRGLATKILRLSPFQLNF